MLAVENIATGIATLITIVAVKIVVVVKTRVSIKVRETIAAVVLTITAVIIVVVVRAWAIRGGKYSKCASKLYSKYYE